MRRSAWRRQMAFAAIVGGIDATVVFANMACLNRSMRLDARAGEGTKTCEVGPAQLDRLMNRDGYEKARRCAESASLEVSSDYELGVVELDDRGEFRDVNQLETSIERFATLGLHSGDGDNPRGGAAARPSR